MAIDLSRSAVRRWAQAYKAGQAAYEGRWSEIEEGAAPAEVIDPGTICPFAPASREHGAWCLGWSERQAVLICAAVEQQKMRARWSEDEGWMCARCGFEGLQFTTTEDPWIWDAYCPRCKDLGWVYAYDRPFLPLLQVEEES